MRSDFLIALCLLGLAPRAQSGEIVFNRDIRPILSDKCFSCHGPDEETQKADLRLDIRESALEALAPGDSEKSELLYRVHTDDEDDLMPPPKAKKGRLSTEEVDLLKRWIEEGAEYQGHWAFEPVAPAEPPKVAGTAHNPIDNFILARLEKAGIKASPEADRATLIRRVSLDLIGLLPTPEEVQAFVEDPDPKAYESLVERLLTSPHHGERWGRHWLDGARYADSHGYSVDSERQMWPYRDWVIQALNEDMPFDRFTIEQLAGDLLPNPTKAQLAATAFHRNTLINQEGGSDPEQFRVEATIDRTNTTGAVWLGLTVGCAQCHTHKFDPITHQEYFELFAFFNNAEDRNNTGATVEIREGELLGRDRETEPEAPAAPDSDKPEWSSLTIASATSDGTPALRTLEDNSLLASEKIATNPTYEVRGSTDLKEIRSLRLTVLTDPSLPKKGPGRAGNGNFVLTGIEVEVDGRPVEIVGASADHAQDGYPITATIDGDASTGWAINVGKGSKAKMNARHDAVLVLGETVSLRADSIVGVTLRHDLNPGYQVGRFRIELSPLVAAQTAAPKPKGNASAKLMVMREGKPRPTYVLTRGDFTRPDKERGELAPGVLSYVAPALPDESRGDRLDLAKWLIDPANPLTPRVTANRIWMRYFGRGIVETEEDFGTQGSLPTHPDLLDWLAAEFVRGGWSMRQLHRLIVTSATYRQSSKARPELAEIDAQNLLLARQERLRMDAEVVRDAALCASGLFAPEIGGPGVRPPQPDGVYAFTQNKKGWRAATGPDRYRRALYTTFFRSAPYPLFTNFDVPNLQTTCTRRVRSNTPLQALQVANDPAFLEFAQGLAARLLTEIPGRGGEALDARITRAYDLALGRPPSARESAVLRSYVAEQGRALAADEKAAASLLNEAIRRTGAPPAEAAAYVCLARVVLNTDNFITRE